jgi:hypothetical protein
MLEEFISFLGSFKNTESLSSELREAIQVETSLETLVTSALCDGRLVLLTGSAGSGKTHLLNNILSHVDSGVVIAREGQSPRAPFILAVPDATELEPADLNKIARTGGRQRIATIIAVNEGPLREAAALDLNSPLSKGIKLLHEAQRGIVREFDAALPTVVDMGAFDPLANGVIAGLLELPLLAEVVNTSLCTCAPADCPRRAAWAQLRSPQVRKRIADVVRLATLTEADWLFRDLWDFIADLSLEGDCDNDPPTSPWFWRLFYGDSRLARALVEVADPIGVALPKADARIFFGDWNSSRLQVMSDLELLPVSQPDANTARFAYVKAQVALLDPTVSLAARVLRVQEGTLAGAVLNGRVGNVLSAMNEYMTYRLRPGASTKLDLVLEHAVKRTVRSANQRSARVHGILKLGEAPSEEFVIRHSRVLVNHFEQQAIAGNRRFLVHVPTAASFELSKDRLRLLHEGRSMRLADRDHVDLAWDLTRFFEGILTLRARAHEFTSVILDFDHITTTSHTYRADTANLIIEAVE